MSAPTGRAAFDDQRTVGVSALAGRATELAEIATALRTGRSVLVSGARGSGRSAVLAEAARQSSAGGAKVLATRPLPGDDGLPGAALQRLLAPVQPRTKVLSAPGSAAFAALFDGRGQVQPLTAAVAELAGQAEEWLWVVDDLDQLDELSRAVLGRVPILAAAVREARDPGWHHVRLGRLRPADAAELVRRTPGARSHFGRRLVLAQAAGNPLALAELGRHLGAAAAIPATSTELPLPDRLRRAIAPAVETLDSVRLEAALLAAFAAETPGPAVRAALDRLVSPAVWSTLVEAGVLHPGRARRFVHPVIRAAVIERAGFARGYDARVRLAGQLQDDGADDGAARAWHRARADPAPGEPVAARLEQAGRDLAGAGKLRAAAYAFAMAAGRSPDPAFARARRTQAAHSAHLAGDPAWAAQLTADPRSTATTAPEVAGTAPEAAGTAPEVAGTAPEVAGTAPGAAGTAPGAAGTAPGVAGTAVLAPLLRLAWMRGDDAARDDVRAVLSAGRPAGPALLGVWARSIVEDPERDDEIQRLLHGYDRARRADGMSPDQRAMALGTIALARHETALAIRHLGRALTLAPPGGLHQPMALGGLAWAHFDAGDLGTARSLAERILSTGPEEARGLPVVDDLRAGARVTLAAVALLRESPESDDRVHEALDAIQPERHPLHHLRLERVRGLADERDGRGELAYRRLRRLYHPDGRPVHHRISDLGLADLAHVAVAVGAADEVAPIVAAAEPRVRALRSARVSGAWHRARALLTGGEAESWYRLALTDPGGDQWPIERALARFDYAQWLRRRQRPGESRPLLAAAGHVFETAELTSWSARAAAELEAAAPPRRGTRAVVNGELTSQQQQVVTLAAQGLTNQQIAVRLALSARTVGTHLSRAYATLGISRRSQLASVADQS